MNSRMIALLAGVTMLGGLASANAGEAVTLTNSQMEAVTAAGDYKKDFTDHDKKFTDHRKKGDHDKKFTDHRKKDYHDKKFTDHRKKDYYGKKWVKWVDFKMMSKPGFQKHK